MNLYKVVYKMKFMDDVVIEIITAPSDEIASQIVRKVREPESILSVEELWNSMRGWV